MTTLRLREQQLDWRQVGDDIVVLDARCAVYLGLEGTGAIVWRLLADTTTRDEIVERLVEIYGVDAKRAEDDLTDFLATLNERGLLAA
jgi:hypothetical protein